MAEVSSIDLSKQELSSIPFGKISQDINWLILSDNRLKSVPAEIKDFRQLSRLALNDNRIDEVCKDIGTCVSITWIDLTRNRLRDLPVEMGSLTRVSGLGLSENEFEDIPPCIFKMKNLRKFGFFSNKIKGISSDIRFLKNLVKLDLSNNRLESIPEEFCTLTNLSWLNLSNNKLRMLPSKISQLSKLEELGLGMNELVEIPDMGNLKSLRILPLFKNKLGKIHESLLSLKSIEKLDFSDNEISEFPVEAVFNPSLKYLNLRNNKIEHIPGTPFGDTISSITMIDLSENRLRFIPYKFFKAFSEITTLRLGLNPYEKNPVKLPHQQSLLHICFTKILHTKNNAMAQPWVNNMFKTYNTCDYCRKSFVVDPYYSYSYSYLDSDHQFVIEKMLCSLKCLRRSDE